MTSQLTLRYSIPSLSPYTTLFRSRLEIGHQIGHADRSRALSFDDDVVAGLLQRREPQHRRQRTTDLIQHMDRRSEEHTSELQSRFDLVCRLLLEEKILNIFSRCSR